MVSSDLRIESRIISSLPSKLHLLPQDVNSVITQMRKMLYVNMFVVLIMQFILACKCSIMNTLCLEGCYVLPFGQWQHYFTMQVNTCRHINRLVPMVTRDGQPQATLEGCLIIANVINSIHCATAHI